MKKLGLILNLFIVTLILSAEAQAITLQIDNGSITVSHLSDMSASNGQLLKYDGTDWIASDLGGLTYGGTWDATSGSAPNATPPSFGIENIASAIRKLTTMTAIKTMIPISIGLSTVTPPLSAIRTQRYKNVCL